MPRQARIYDMSLSVGTHGEGCCPHSILGIWIRGSENHHTNNLPSIRYFDIGINISCPHCGINMAINGSPNKDINNKAAHRVHDAVTTFCGIGQTITGSHNSEVN